MQKFHINDVSLGSASDQMKQISNQSDTLPCQDLGIDMPSVWSFCARFSDIILWGNHDWCHKMFV